MSSDAKAVLIVDDEPEVCQLVQEKLSDAGFRCVTTTDPEEGRDMLGTGRYRVLVADIYMPEISGLDLLSYVKQNVPDCQVILMTGLSNRQSLAQALVLGAFDYLEKPFWTEDLVEMVQRAAAKEEQNVLSSRAAQAMEVSQSARQAALQSVHALARAIEAKDPYTHRHSEHVAGYVRHIAETMGLSEEERESAWCAALLHDIGKIGVADSILTKPGPLTDEEMASVRRHPELGADILAKISLFGAEADAVRQHHENWDGSGYPKGLDGNKIDLAARLIHVADAMDAMLMDRSYRQSRSPDGMIDELTRWSGRAFDPDIVSLAADWARENRHLLSRPHEAQTRPMAAV